MIYNYLYHGSDAFSVVDAYSDWSGPTVAMVSQLKKVRNETGDKLLNFATVSHKSAVTAFRNVQFEKAMC